MEPGLCSLETERGEERKKVLQDQNEVARRTGNSNILSVQIRPENEINRDRNVIKPFRWTKHQMTGSRKLLIQHIIQWSFSNALPQRVLNLLTS